jgi:hypothetical protein
MLIANRHGSALRSPAAAQWLRRSFAPTGDREKFDDLSVKGLSKSLKNGDRGVF